MLSLNRLLQLAKLYQTDFRNIAREYIQHQFLSFLYQDPQAEKLLFKGGTALRIIYGSPRFSEDLDFTGQNVRSSLAFDALFLEAVRKIANIGVSLDIKEAKKTSGGYLGIIDYKIYSLRGTIKFEVSLRKSKQLSPEVNAIISELSIPYTILHLNASDIVKGKIEALLSRSKPRDFYDLYFILRHPALRLFIKSNDLLVVKNVLQKSRINFKHELSALLPKNHHLILRDFQAALLREINQRIA